MRKSLTFFNFNSSMQKIVKKKMELSKFYIFRTKGYLTNVKQILFQNILV